MKNLIAKQKNMLFNSKDLSFLTVLCVNIYLVTTTLVGVVLFTKPNERDFRLKIPITREFLTF